MRKLLAFLLATGISAPLFSEGEVPVAGKSGAGLAAVLRSEGRIERLADPGELDLTVADPFEGADVEIRRGALPQGYVWGSLVNADWWRELPVYGDTVARDLFNLFPLSADVVRHRADLPPGTVVTPTYANPYWCSGYGELAGVETEFYEPPAGLRGRLARTIFYMAVMYPQGVLRPRAYTVFTGEAYPGLTRYASELLMGWHKAYPPGEDEAALNVLAREMQGNVNPFVADPRLADYLWGDHAGEPYPGDGAAPVPLHGSYRSGETVFLSSPHIPEGVEWTVDGRQRGRIASIAASDLGKGEHTLVYCGGGMKGSVIIKVDL